MQYDINEEKWNTQAIYILTKGLFRVYRNFCAVLLNITYHSQSPCDNFEYCG